MGKGSSKGEMIVWPTVGFGAVINGAVTNYWWRFVGGGLVVAACWWQIAGGTW